MHFRTSSSGYEEVADRSATSCPRHLLLGNSRVTKATISLLVDTRRPRFSALYHSRPVNRRHAPPKPL